jgi:desulfoferrodoxin (superoxide reductase-like protein)
MANQDDAQQDEDQIEAPDDWTDSVGYSHENIRLRNLVFDELSEKDAEGIRDAISISSARERHIERVFVSDDPTKVEVVWFNDDAEIHDDSVKGDVSYTELEEHYIHSVRNVLQRFFGPNWIVRRKEDSRFGKSYKTERRYSKHPQRAAVRRVVAQRFKIQDETEEEYRMRIKDTPDDLPENAIRYGELDCIAEPSIDLTHDWYIYVSDTGTKHIIRSEMSYHNLRQKELYRDVQADCGMKLSPDDAVEAARDGRLYHVAYENLDGLWETDEWYQDVCGRCKRDADHRPSDLGTIEDYVTGGGKDV